jgi:hypothetical protein
MAGLMGRHGNRSEGVEVVAEEALMALDPHTPHPARSMTAWASWAPL